MRRVRGLSRISLSYNILPLFSADASIYVSFSPSYFELNVDFMPQKYYPRIGFSDSQSIRMMLHLKKRGGLNLNL